MRVLKKILLWLLLVAVLAALIVGGAVAWFYYNTDPEAFDAPAVTAGGTALAVNGYEWNAPVMGGVLFKSASAPATLETQDLGTWEQASLDITLPADRPTHLVVKEASGNVLLDVNNEAQVTVAFPGTVPPINPARPPTDTACSGTAPASTSAHNPRWNFPPRGWSRAR